MDNMVIIIIAVVGILISAAVLWVVIDLRSDIEELNRQVMDFRSELLQFRSRQSAIRQEKTSVRPPVITRARTTKRDTSDLEPRGARISTGISRKKNTDAKSFPDAS